MTRLEQKIKNFYTKTMEALWHYYKHDDPETAFHCFRYSGEAFMKAIIFKIYGDQDGNDITEQYKNTENPSWLALPDGTDLRILYILMFGILVAGILAAKQILEQ